MLQRLRAASVHTPILILSARAELDEKVKFLRFGADDFLTKPFDPRELTARILAIVRRSKGHSASTIRTGKLAVNLDTRVVSVDDQPVHLTPKEYSALELLSLRKGTILTKEVFLNYLYGGLDEPECKIVDVVVCKLRKKLAQATGGHHYIETQSGQGYVLREPAAMPAAAPVAGPEDLGAPHNQDGTRATEQCPAGQAYRPRVTRSRNGIHDLAIVGGRTPTVGPDAKPRSVSAVEMRFEDAITKDGGPLSGLPSMVENQLLRVLPSGGVQAAVIARQLDMSVRSLTRRLAEEGTTFGEILDGLRNRLALRYLEDQRMSLQQIAWLLGYSEPTAFNHAFKRWFGTSPGRAALAAA
jgi:two-component system cell cycle response regulator CtrA